MQLERLPPAALVALALLAGLTCQLLLGTSYVAATLDPLREERGIPVAVVLLDQGAHGSAWLDALDARASPIDWVPVATREEALGLLREKRAFGAMVVPEDFSASLESFASDAPRAALVETFTSPGASTSGSLIAGRAIELALEGLRERVREEALRGAVVGTTGLGALTLEQGRFLAQPVHARATLVNPVPEGGANGLAPTYLAMGAWIGGYLGAIALERFRPFTKLRPLARAGLMAGASLMNGALATGAALAVGLAVPDAAQLAIMIALGTWMAYCVVALFTDLVGLAAIIPAFALLALGLPASGALYPVGLLPDLYRTLHAIDPFTWLVEGMRTVLYARDAGDLDANARKLAGLAVACTVASLLMARVARSKT